MLSEYVHLKRIHMKKKCRSLIAPTYEVSLDFRQPWPFFRFMSLSEMRMLPTSTLAVSSIDQIIDIYFLPLRELLRNNTNIKHSRYSWTKVVGREGGRGPDPKPVPRCPWRRCGLDHMMCFTTSTRSFLMNVTLLTEATIIWQSPTRQRSPFPTLMKPRSSADMNIRGPSCQTWTIIIFRSGDLVSQTSGSLADSKQQ